MYCEKLALEREKERNKTRKFTIALISVGHLCFYPVCSRKKWDVLQKLLMDIVQESSPCGVGAAAFVV
jgi:hypothetical protein